MQVRRRAAARGSRGFSIFRKHRQALPSREPASNATAESFPTARPLHTQWHLRVILAQIFLTTVVFLLQRGGAMRTIRRVVTVQIRIVRRVYLYGPWVGCGKVLPAEHLGTRRSILGERTPSVGKKISQDIATPGVYSIPLRINQTSCSLFKRYVSR